MKQAKFLIPVALFSFFVIAHQASAAITVGSSSISGSGDVNLQPSSGNVGIGTSAPTTKLQVTGGTSWFEGNVAIGSDDPSANILLTLEKTGTVTATQTGESLYVDVTPSCSGCSLYGLTSYIYARGSSNLNYVLGHDFSTNANNSGTLSNLMGLNVYTANNNQSLTTNAYGIYNQLAIGSTTTNAYAMYVNSGIYSGTTTNYYSFYVVNPDNFSTLTNNYAFVVQGQTSGINNAGIVIGETTGTKQTNVLIGTLTQPSGSYSIYNSSTDPNYFAGALTVGVITATSNSKLEVKDGHIASTQTTAPTPSVTGSGYSGATLAATSTDTKGAITATVGAAAGTLVITFQTGYATAPHCAVTPASATAQVDEGKMYITKSTSALTLNFVATPTGGSETWDYICFQ